jgi:hypothetical protein
MQLSSPKNRMHAAFFSRESICVLDIKTRSAAFTSSGELGSHDFRSLTYHSSWKKFTAVEALNDSALNATRSH